MRKREKEGLKTASVIALLVIFFDLSDDEGFSPIKTLMIFLGTFALYEALGFIGNKLKKWK